MASLWRRKKDGPYYITYTLRPGKRKTVCGCKDRKATEALARKLEGDAMLRREGIINSRAEKLAHAEALPLEDHLKAFESALLGKGATRKHISTALYYIREVNKACGFEKPSDFDPAEVSVYVVHLKRNGVTIGRQKPRIPSARSINARLTAIKSFTRWLFRNERMRTDPMMQVAKLNANTDRRHVRRALTDDELAWLIATAEKGPVVCHMAGPDRAMLYRLAVETGLRASELGSLTLASFDLADPTTASVKVAAAYSKHRRDDLVPLRRDLAEALIVFLASRPADMRLFAMPDKPAEMMRADLTAARKAWIAEAKAPEETKRREESKFLNYEDASGHVADFHALRHTFITRLARSGITPAVAKSLARHSTITLTMDYYTHTLISDERTALDRLPGITPKPPEREIAQATGTDDIIALPSPPADTHYTPSGAQRLAQRAECPTEQEALPLVNTTAAGNGEDVTPADSHKPIENRRLATTGLHLSSLAADKMAGAPPRTRTLDPLIKSQLLYQLS